MPIVKGITSISGANINNTTPTITVPKHRPSHTISNAIVPIIIPDPINTLKIHTRIPIYHTLLRDNLFSTT